MVLDDEAFVDEEESPEEASFEEDSYEEDSNEEEKQYFKSFRKAVDEEDEELINLLIQEEGVLEKNFHIFEGTFLNVVAERGTIETAMKICQLGVDINVCGDSHETPIYYAVKNSAKMVNFLIENGADVNFRSWKGETPLHHAVRHSAEMVKVLLKNGAKVDVTDNYEVTLLHEALLSGTEETVRLVLNKILSKIKNKYKKVKKTEELVTTLFDNKELLKIVEKDYPLLILFVAKIGNDDIFKFTLNEIKKTLNMNNYIKYLNRVPMELNIGGYYNRTALHYAIRQNLPEVVRFLLKAGADVNCRTKQNFTPLHYAACLENEEICKILMNFGADVNSTSPGLGSPLYQVCGKSTIRKSLKSNDRYFYEEDLDESTECQVFNPKLAKLLLESGANPDIVGFNGNTPFLEVCTAGSLEPLKLLLQFYPVIRRRDFEGNSALHHAALGNSLEIVQFLLEKGFDINVKNVDDCTPLLLLMKTCESKLLEMTEYLVDHGADVNAANCGGLTALHVAVFEEFKEFAESLLDLGADWKLEHVFDLSRRAIHPLLECSRNTYTSFIALKESKLENYIKFYFGFNLEELPKVSKYFETSKLEVEKLKSRKIVPGSCVSFHDFLTGNVYNTVQVAKNVEVRKMFNSFKYLWEFPCYHYLLQKRYERIIGLTDAVDRMDNFLVTCLSPLPTLFIRKILNFLSPSDFRNFDRNLSVSNGVVEQEADSNLIFGKIYDSEVVEIRDTGVMVSLNSDIPPVLVLNSQLNMYTDSNIFFINFKIGSKLRVMYQGRYPATGQIRLTAKVI